MRKSFVAAAVVILWVILVSAQEAPLFKIEANSIRPTDPGWRCVGGILNRPPGPARSEKPLIVSSCDKDLHNGERQRINVFVFKVDSLSDAMLALSPLRDKKTTPGWAVKRSKVGEEAFSATFRDGRQFEIHFRKGFNVVELHSNSFPLAKKVAQEIALQLPLK